MGNKNQQKPTIAVAADHRGFNLKTYLKEWLENEGYGVIDCGTDSTTRVDSQDYGMKAIKVLKEGRASVAIMMSCTGQSMNVIANRFPFIKCALVTTIKEAQQAKAYMGANVLAIGGDFVTPFIAKQIIEAFMATEEMGDRYAVRRQRIAELNVNAVDWDEIELPA